MSTKHEKNTSCINASGRGIEFRAAIRRSENRAAAASPHCQTAKISGAGYVWIDGYWYADGRRYKWHNGYWTRPPYEGARWIGPRYEGGQFFAGYWDSDRGRFDHDHRWDRDRNRDFGHDRH